MEYEIQFAPSAIRDLKKIDGNPLRRVVDAIEALADDPRPPGCTKLTNEDNYWRIRVGQYRVIYQIADDRLIVLVVRIAHRRDVIPRVGRRGIEPRTPGFSVLCSTN